MKKLLLVACVLAFVSGIPFLGGFASSPDSPEKMNCANVADHAKALTLKNGFGAQFEIIKVSNLRQQHRSADKIQCSAELLLDSGITQASTLTYTVEGDEFFILVAAE